MNQYKGKIIGALLGFATKRPIFIILGIIIGHLYDIGIFSKKLGDAGSKQSSSDQSGVENPYAVLGVSEQASQDDIEQAYRRMISDYHPDKVANAADEIKALAERRAREINTAYEEIQKLRKQP